MTLFALLFSLASAQEGSVRLEITQTDNTQGQMLVVLFSSADGWPSESTKAVQRMIVPPTMGTTVAVFNHVPPGTYAAFALHDEDGDGECDLKSVIPMPKEPFGASRDAKAWFGPPKFADAVFTVGAGETLQRFKLQRF